MATYEKVACLIGRLSIAISLSLIALNGHLIRYFSLMLKL